MKANGSRKIRLSKRFKPCSIDDEDELYPNGIFVFNITKMQAFISEVGLHPERIDVESHWTGLNDHLDEVTIEKADISKPIILAEIRPDSYNVIDGNHRLEKAHRLGEKTILAYKVQSPDHIPFLTSQKGYESYIEYWNDKLKDDEYHQSLRNR